MRPAVILLGPTGAGKSQQAAMLSQSTGMAVVGSGKLLRQTGDEELLRLLDRGELASTELVQRLVREELQRLPAGQPIVLDGFPRNLDEARWLDASSEDLDMVVTAALSLEIDRRTAMARISGRGRSDDNTDSFDQKWDIYHSAVEPVLNYYRDKGLLHTIDGNRTPDEVAEEIEEVLDDIELN